MSGGMTDRERLIELLDGYYFKESPNMISYFTERECEKLADYLLENNVIISPCKVGDTVYQTDTNGVRVYESKIKTMVYDCGTYAFDETAIGKSIFLSREEAEQIAKGR